MRRFGQRPMFLKRQEKQLQVIASLVCQIALVPEARGAKKKKSFLKANKRKDNKAIKLKTK